MEQRITGGGWEREKKERAEEEKGVGRTSIGIRVLALLTPYCVTPPTDVACSSDPA
jgi:hypothetical protein